jgi:hypothetical protein
VSRRSRTSSLPALLGDDVARELARLGQAPAGHGDMAAVLAAWPSAVGDAISSNAWPARFTRDGTLIVHASSSAWAFELEQLSESVRERLGPLAPPRLRFVVGPLPERGAETVSKVHREPPVPGPAERAQADEITREIDAPELREAVARAVAASLARACSRDEPTAPSDTLHR